MGDESLYAERLRLHYALQGNDLSPIAVQGRCQPWLRGDVK
jgi:hypothetical protein